LGTGLSLREENIECHTFYTLIPMDTYTNIGKIDIDMDIDIDIDIDIDLILHKQKYHSQKKEKKM